MRPTRRKCTECSDRPNAALPMRGKNQSAPKRAWMLHIEPSHSCVWSPYGQTAFGPPRVNPGIICGMLTSSLKRVCLLGCLLAFVVPIAAGQVAADNFIVGVLRANGIIIPFARHDGPHWANSWPEPADRPTAPPAPLEQIPREWLSDSGLASNWRLWRKWTPIIGQPGSRLENRGACARGRNALIVD